MEACPCPKCGDYCPRPQNSNLIFPLCRFYGPFAVWCAICHEPTHATTFHQFYVTTYNIALRSATLPNTNIAATTTTGRRVGAGARARTTVTAAPMGSANRERTGAGMKGNGTNSVMMRGGRSATKEKSTSLRGGEKPPTQQLYVPPPKQQLQLQERSAKAEMDPPKKENIAPGETKKSDVDDPFTTSPPQPQQLKPAPATPEQTTVKMAGQDRPFLHPSYFSSPHSLQDSADRDARELAAIQERLDANQKADEFFNRLEKNLIGDDRAPVVNSAAESALPNPKPPKMEETDTMKRARELKAQLKLQMSQQSQASQHLSRPGESSDSPSRPLAEQPRASAAAAIARSSVQQPITFGAPSFGAPSFGAPSAPAAIARSSVQQPITFGAPSALRSSSQQHPPNPATQQPLPFFPSGPSAMPPKDAPTGPRSLINRSQPNPASQPNRPVQLASAFQGLGVGVNPKVNCQVCPGKHETFSLECPFNQDIYGVASKLEEKLGDYAGPKAFQNMKDLLQYDAHSRSGGPCIRWPVPPKLAREMTDEQFSLILLDVLSYQLPQNDATPLMDRPDLKPEARNQSSNEGSMIPKDSKGMQQTKLQCQMCGSKTERRFVDAIAMLQHVMGSHSMIFRKDLEKSWAQRRRRHPRCFRCKLCSDKESAAYRFKSFQDVAQHCIGHHHRSIGLTNDSKLLNSWIQRNMEPSDETSSTSEEDKHPSLLPQVTSAQVGSGTKRKNEESASADGAKRARMEGVRVKVEDGSSGREVGRTAAGSALMSSSLRRESGPDRAIGRQNAGSSMMISPLRGDSYRPGGYQEYRPSDRSGPPAFGHPSLGAIERRERSLPVPADQIRMGGEFTRSNHRAGEYFESPFGGSYYNGTGVRSPPPHGRSPPPNIRSSPPNTHFPPLHAPFPPPRVRRRSPPSIPLPRKGAKDEGRLTKDWE